MKTPDFIKNYKSDDIKRLDFNRLALDTFNIDFENWYQGGHWNDRYICYSYFDSQIVSNASLNLMDLIVNGAPVKAIQIGTVMTDPNYREQGLATDLINRIMNDYASQTELFYLFCKPHLVSFYQRFGFTEIKEHAFSLDFSHHLPKPADTHKLDLTQKQDRQLVNRLVMQRSPISQVFGVENGEHILSWYTYNDLFNHFYYCHDRDIILIFEIENDILHLYDVLSAKPLTFAQINDYLNKPDIDKIRFHFTPDLLDVQCKNFKPMNSDKIMIRSDSFKIDTPFKHPVTARA